MKKSMLLLVALLIFTSVVLKAQSPQKINFQSIVRNTSGVIVSNKSVNFKITILSGSTTGTPVYSETHLKTTDAIGLVSLQIGIGTVSSGVFSSIDWGNASHFIKLEADFTGGNTYVTLGTQELMSVPYAMYASKSDTASLNLTNRFAEKAPINNPIFTGTVGGITKAMVGLSDVENTSDANKQVSAATQTALDAKVNIADTSNMLANYQSGINSKVNIADTSSMLTNYRSGINAKVNIADTSIMLTNYRSGINAKLNIADTSNMLANYRSGINAKLNTIDTTILSNRISTKLNGKDTAFLSSRIDTKLSATDTSSLSNRIDTKFNKADFPSGSSANEILYWNGTKWISLSPGATGQSLIMSSTGLSWGCIITNTVAAPSSTPTLVVNTALTEPITIATTGATGIDTTASGLPNGVTAAWLANVITISGTPTATGTFNYTIPLTGGCGTVNATGTIIVILDPCPTLTVPDIDGNIYNTVGIGAQCWTKENLRVSSYNDGTLIPIVTSGWGALTTGGRSWYDNDSTDNEIPYGNLYNWYAAKGIVTSGGTPDPTKNICPYGWHIPTDSDWNKLVKFLDSGADTSSTSLVQSTTAGFKMKSFDYSNYYNDNWYESQGTTNSSGFSALPGGFRIGESFGNIRFNAYFWSATEIDNDLTSAWFRYLYYYNGYVGRGNSDYVSDDKSVGASVRCLRDSSITID